MSDRLESHLELPVELSHQKPLEESSHIKKARTPVPQSCEEGDPHSKETQKPVEESVPSMGPGGMPSTIAFGSTHLPATLMGIQVTTTYTCIEVVLL